VDNLFSHRIMRGTPKFEWVRKAWAEGVLRYSLLKHKLTGLDTSLRRQEIRCCQLRVWNNQVLLTAGHQLYGQFNGNW